MPETENTVQQKRRPSPRQVVLAAAFNNRFCNYWLNRDSEVETDRLLPMLQVMARYVPIQDYDELEHDLKLSVGAKL